MHSCNSVFDVLIRISGTCTSASGLKFPALRKKKEDANQHWISICTESETEIARRIDAKVSIIHVCWMMCVGVGVKMKMAALRGQ